MMGDVVQWVARLTHNRSVVSSNPIKGTTLMAKNWLVPGTDSSLISESN